jgi:hypothetical protein
LFDESRVADPRPPKVHEFVKDHGSFGAPATKSLFLRPVPDRLLRTGSSSLPVRRISSTQESSRPLRSRSPNG